VWSHAGSVTSRTAKLKKKYSLSIAALSLDLLSSASLSLPTEAKVAATPSRNRVTKIHAPVAHRSRWPRGSPSLPPCGLFLQRAGTRLGRKPSPPLAVMSPVEMTRKRARSTKLPGESPSSIPLAQMSPSKRMLTVPSARPAALVCYLLICSSNKSEKLGIRLLR
jgi:hypothetical protein